jgi:hypothetical protein
MTLALLGAGPGAAASGGGGGAPTNVKGWWDASVTASLTLSGTDILSVADQSGNGNTLNWTTAKPVYLSTGLGGTGKPAISIDAQTRASALTGSMNLTGSTLTAWFVGYTDSSLAFSSVAGILSYTGNGLSADWNNLNSFYIGMITNANTMAFYRNTGNPTLSVSANTPHIVIITVDGTGASTFYVDGVSSAGTTVASSWTGPGTVYIGRDRSGDFWSGRLGEFGIASDYLSSSDVATFYASLKTKWGL